MLQHKIIAINSNPTKLKLDSVAFLAILRQNADRVKTFELDRHRPSNIRGKMIKLPTGEKVEGKILTYTDSGKPEDIWVRAPHFVQLPNGMRVEAISVITYNDKGMVTAAELCDPLSIMMPNGEPALALRITFTDEGNISDVIFDEPQTVRFINGRQALAHYVTFNEHGEIISARLAGGYEFQVLKSQKLSFKSVTFNDQGMLIGGVLGREPQPLILPTGQKAQVKGMIYFDDNGELLRVDLAKPLSGEANVTGPAQNERIYWHKN